MRDHGLFGEANEARYGDHFVRRGTTGLNAAIHWTLAVYGASGPEVRSRRRVQDPDGGFPVIERVEDRRYVSFRLQREGQVLHAKPAISAFPLAAAGASSAVTDADQAELRDGLATLEILRATGNSLNEAEPSTLRLRVRGPGSRDLAADLPRAALLRLVLGRELDTTPERPLPALGTAQAVLGGARALLVMLDPEEARPPWTGPALYVSGEEDAARIARALRLWWRTSASTSPPAIAVATDPAASVRRWAVAPRPTRKPSIAVAIDAFPGARSSWRAKALETLSANPESTTSGQANVVVLVSAEAPGVLGARLSALARDPAMKGKMLAVAALSSEIRADLPAALLAEGNLAAIGVFTTGPVGVDRALTDIGGFVRALDAAADGSRVEEIPGPFVWFY